MKKERSKQSKKKDIIEEIVNEVLADYREFEVSTEPVSLEQVQLEDVSKYDATKQCCWSFCHNHDSISGLELNLGNMVNGYPFTMLGHDIVNSECAYIAGCYSSEGQECLDVQNQLSTFTNGLKAKRVFRRANNGTTALIRADWSFFNFEFMTLVLWNKVQSNAAFREMLMSIPQNAIIIENTSNQKTQKNDTRKVWGSMNMELRKIRKEYIDKSLKRLRENGITAKNTKGQVTRLVYSKVNNIGVWEGRNATGKILQQCKIALHNNTEPVIDYKLLNEKNIYWFGELLKFDR